MKNILTNDFASELFDLSEDSIYNILEEFNENQNIDKTLTYVFIKAFYIHIAKVILDKENISLNFDEVYSKYRMYLSIYYKSNNSQISQELLNEILDAFDKSFAIIESLEFNRIEDSYEFRPISKCDNLLSCKINFSTSGKIDPTRNKSPNCNSSLTFLEIAMCIFKELIIIVNS